MKVQYRIPSSVTGYREKNVVKEETGLARDERFQLVFAAQVRTIHEEETGEEKGDENGDDEDGTRAAEDDSISVDDNELGGRGWAQEPW